MSTPTPDQLAALRAAMPDVEINDNGYLVKRTDAPTPQALYQMTEELHKRVNECGFVLAVRAPFGANICGMVQGLGSRVNPTATNAPSAGPTPTPEDIDLGWDLAGVEDNHDRAQIIAGHCAPMREKIVALEQELATVKRDREYLATHWAGQLETAHKVIAESATNPGRVPVLVGGKVVADSFGNILFREAPHPMVELAEIGRLAVEARWPVDSEYVPHPLRPALPAVLLAQANLRDAIDAYLARRPTGPTP